MPRRRPGCSTRSRTAQKVSQVREVVGQVQDAGGWMVEVLHDWWWLVLVVAGIAGVHYGRAIILRRLAEHRSAVNMGL
jgi:hypothetical protein